MPLRLTLRIPRLVAACFFLVVAPVAAIAQPTTLPAQPGGPRQMENLSRGLVGVRLASGGTFLSWRLLGTDPEGVAFNVYRSTERAAPVRLNLSPLTGPTNFTDTAADPAKAVAYTVRAVVGGREQAPSAPFGFVAGAAARDYFSIPLKTPEGYTPNDASVGDLDGDGEYEIVLHQAGSGRDNSQAGITDPPILQAYRLDGTLLWTINLGKNIREGAHYTQFMVYDLDGDGRAEVACKTADGTVDGVGKVIGDAKADWRNDRGYILAGPEFLTVFNGLTGAAMATVPYNPPRHPTDLRPSGQSLNEIWGDAYGNRMDRFLACIAYLDGKRPSLVMCRGYYTRTTLAAWDWRNGKLTQRWFFDSDASAETRKFRGQGNHSVFTADVDDDGKDEIVYGALVIDDNGRALYSTGLGHGDAQHTSDLDPSNPGLEIFSIHENARHDEDVEMRDARTGRRLWSKASGDVGRGLAADIDPRFPGAESWASSFGTVFGVRGDIVSEKKPRSCNFAVWWDGDPLREILDSNRITKWDWLASTERNLLVATDCVSNNGTKSTPALSADLFGDWREEVMWRTRDGKELRIYTTTIPTALRMTTLMHDSQYRTAIATQNVAYNQPPHPRFFIGSGMVNPPRPHIAVTPLRR